MATNKYPGHLGTISLSSTVLPTLWQAFVDEADLDTSRTMIEATQFNPPQNAEQFEPGLIGATTLRFGGFCDRTTFPTLTTWTSTTITDATITYYPVSGRTVTFTGYDASLRVTARKNQMVRWELTAQWSGATAITLS